MGIQMYKDGKSCNADAGQVPAMEAGGWSTNAPTSEETEKAQAQASQQTAQGQTPQATKEDDKPKVDAQSPASS